MIIKSVVRNLKMGGLSVFRSNGFSVLGRTHSEIEPPGPAI
jgi:hypothetical protein